MGLNSFGLDAFFMCAQELNFTRAAKRLHITQSALSQRIHNLEEEIGATLFFRERLGVRLTESGEDLLHYCQLRAKLEENLTHKKTHGLQELSGSLRIAGYSSVMRSLILPGLKTLVQKNPRIQLHLLTKELHELPELLKSGRVDFLILDHHWQREGIQSLALGQEENVRIRKKGSEFTGYFLDHDPQDETTLKFLKNKAGSKIKRHYLDDIYGLIDGVIAGFGDAIVPQHMIHGLKGIEIVETSRMSNPVVLHFHDHGLQLPLHKAFIDSVAETAQKQL